MKKQSIPVLGVILFLYFFFTLQPALSQPMIPDESEIKAFLNQHPLLVDSGTLAANLVNGGTISPGVSPGLITVDGDYTQQETGLLIIELGGTTAGTEYDQLVVTGTATMHGTLTVTVLPGFTPQVGDTFFIIDHVTGTGTFDTVSLPPLDGGLEMEIDFSDDGVTLTVVEGDTFSIYLPLIVK